MSLEQKIDELTAALQANTAALLGGGAKADKPAATGKTDKPAATGKADKPAAYEAKHTKTEALAAIDEVKTKKGVPAAKAIIAAVGFAKLNEITEPKDLDSLYDKAKEALGDGEDDM